jgi:hypothetical protein
MLDLVEEFDYKPPPPIYGLLTHAARLITGLGGASWVLHASSHPWRWGGIWKQQRSECDYKPNL